MIVNPCNDCRGNCAYKRRNYSIFLHEEIKLLCTNKFLKELLTNNCFIICIFLFSYIQYLPPVTGPITPITKTIRAYSRPTLCFRKQQHAIKAATPCTINDEEITHKNICHHIAKKLDVVVLFIYC